MRVWSQLRDPAGGFDPVEAWHRDVHEHDIGLYGLDAQQCLVAVARLADHFDVVECREQGPKPGADERVVCILTGHQLKDPTATVAYHTTDQDQFNKVLGSRGVRRASFANRAVAVPNELGEIVKAIQLYS